MITEPPLIQQVTVDRNEIQFPDYLGMYIAAAAAAITAAPELTTTSFKPSSIQPVHVDLDTSDALGEYHDYNGCSGVA